MRIVVQGVDVHVSDVGQGQPILFIHGNPDSSEIWDGVIARLRHRYRCIAFDLPGFGRSTGSDQLDCSPENLGRFVSELVTTLNIREPIDVVAHDFGGAFAMAWAATEPQRVRRLTVINHPFYVAGYRWHLWARIWRLPWIGGLGARLMDWWPLFYVSLKAGSRRLSKEQIRATHALVTPATKRMVLRLYRAIGPREFHDWHPRVLRATRQNPTLALWGQHDPFVPAGIASAFGACRFACFDDSGHWAPAEVPDRVAEEIDRFLSIPEGDERIAQRPSPSTILPGEVS